MVILILYNSSHLTFLPLTLLKLIFNAIFAGNTNFAVHDEAAILVLGCLIFVLGKIFWDFYAMIRDRLSTYLTFSVVFRHENIFHHYPVSVLPRFIRTNLSQSQSIRENETWRILLHNFDMILDACVYFQRPQILKGTRDWKIHVYVGKEIRQITALGYVRD